MELLSKLSPAETLMLLRPYESRLRDFMQFTMMDLLTRQALHLLNYDMQPVQGNATLSLAYVVAGRNFKKEEPLLHEMIFLYPFYKKPASKILFTHFIQIAIKASKGEENFKRKYLLAGELKPLIHIGFWQRIFGSFSLTEEGKMQQQAIIRHLNFLDKELPVMMKEQKEKAGEYINQVKGNVFLLNALKFELLHLLGAEIGRVETELEGG
ncbi:MAG: hypothetical protein K1X61_05165 [Chitinophagales bacterium]|nr:hypothetical protein [Chitinophagales bacterium]